MKENTMTQLISIRVVLEHAGEHPTGIHIYKPPVELGRRTDTFTLLVGEQAYADFGGPAHLEVFVQRLDGDDN